MPAPIALISDPHIQPAQLEVCKVCYSDAVQRFIAAAGSANQGLGQH
jgi:hypothetical protein